MKKEPAYGSTIYTEFDGGTCGCAPALAKYFGYYDNYGLNVEVVSGSSITDALGTNKIQFSMNHISHMLVPITNGVDIVFTGCAQTGCKSLYVLADSDINSMNDLVGKTVGLPEGYGSSDHNIAIRFMQHDNIPIDQIKFSTVESSASVASMKSGEIAGAVMSDQFAYKMVKDGTLRHVRSITWDEDFQQEVCCVLGMNATFVRENPIMAEKITECVMKADQYIQDHQEEATQIMLDQGYTSGDYNMVLELVKSQNFGVTYDACKATIASTAKDYIAAGLINSSYTVDSVLDLAWDPLSSKK